MGAIETFNDFMTATENSVLSGPDQLLNEAVKKSYLYREFMRGKEYTEVVQGGPKITDQIMFDEKSTYDHVSPSQTHVWSNPQVIDEWEIPWRYGLDYSTWTDQEIELQFVDGMTSTARHRVLKRIKSAKERRMVTSTVNGLEDELFANPSQTQMEAQGGKAPLSIAAHINEGTNGVHEAWTGTVKQGIDTALESKWAPQVATYDNNVAANTAFVASTASVQTAIIDAFDSMYYDIGFDTLPGYESYGEGYSNATMIVCSKLGINTFKQAMRAAQDTYVTPSRQDPAYNKPLYSGIALVYASNLDTATLYPNAAGSGIGQETGASNDLQRGPRYYWLNRKYIKPVFHSKRYMYRHPVRTHPNQPSTHIQVMDCWHNYPAQSLQRHGIVVPV